MTTPDTTTPPADPEIPVAVVRPRRVSLVWLVPVAAVALVVVLVATQALRGRGTPVVLRFHDAAGLGPGSEIVHRGLTVGVVRSLRLTEDMTGVLVTAELAPHAEALATEGTEFWIVRPEVSLQRVTGLDTLLGPRYIAVRPGPPDAPRRTRFDGLDDAPPLAPPADGSLRVTLRAARAGSLAPGAPVLYREVRVGTVRSVRLAPDATGVLIAADVDPAYTSLVRDNTRFWRSGGVGVDFGLFTGLTVRADSLTSAITSAVSLATPKRPGQPPSPDAVFDLADVPESEWLGWSPPIELNPPDPGSVRP